MDKYLLKFIYIAPTVKLTKIHENRPYFELPISMVNDKWKGILVAGKIETERKEALKFYETGIVSDRIVDIFKVIGSIERILNKEKPNLVVFFQLNFLIPFFVVKYKIRVKLCGTKNIPPARSKWAVKLDWDGEKFLDSRIGYMQVRNIFIVIISYLVDWIIVESTCAEKKVKSIPLIKPDKIKIIPNTFSSKYKKIKYGSIKRENIVLCVARITAKKGIDLLVRAFLQIIDRYPSWSLEIIGPIVEKKYYDNMIQTISNNDAIDKIVFSGPLFGDKLESRFKKSSVFCLPSNEEGFSIARAEAVAFGLPIVTTKAGCGDDFSKFGSLVVEKGDLTGIRGALEELLSDEKLREKIADSQQKHFAEYVDVAQSYSELYETQSAVDNFNSSEKNV